MHFSQYLTCLLFQPPPRRPLAYANQNETDEERQFRKVFQQLAGDVSRPVLTSYFLSVLSNVVFNFHFIGVFKCLFCGAAVSNTISTVSFIHLVENVSSPMTCIPTPANKDP